MKERIGFIGLGIMGAPMAERMLQAGYTLSVYNRTKVKGDSLVQHGARWCETPLDVAEISDVVFSMISTPSVLESITLGNTGVLSGLHRGAVHIDCSTVSPELTKRLEKEYAKKECSFLHSPVLGGVAQVIDGTLLLFVGGDKQVFTRVEQILKVISMKIWHFPQIEQATIMKLMCNSIIASLISALAQLFVVGRKTGIDPQTFLDILSYSKLNAPTFQIKGKSMIDRDFAPRFFVEHLLKDITLLIDMAGLINAPVPVIESIQKLYTQAKEAGLGKEDYSAILKILEQKAGIEVP